MDTQEALKKLDAAYLIMGTEELEKERRIEKLLSLFDGDFVDFNREILRPESELEPHQLQAALNALPVMADKRLVYLKDIDRFDKALVEQLIEYLKEPLETNVVLASAKSVAKNTRLYKAFSGSSQARIIVCEAKKPWELSPEVIKLAAQYQLKLSKSGAELMIELQGSSLLTLDNELKRLALLFPAGHSLSCDDIHTHVARIAELKPWAVLDACAQRKLHSTLNLMKLLPQNSELCLFYLLVDRLRELRTSQIYLQDGVSEGLAQFLSKQAWQVKNYPSWARNYSPQELNYALHSSFACEEQLKSSVDKQHTLAQWIISFMHKTDK